MSVDNGQIGWIMWAGLKFYSKPQKKTIRGLCGKLFCYCCCSSWSLTADYAVYKWPNYTLKECWTIHFHQAHEFLSKLGFSIHSPTAMTFLLVCITWPMSTCTHVSHSTLNPHSICRQVPSSIPVHLHLLWARFSMLCCTFGFRPTESKPELVPTRIFLLPHSCQPVNSLPLLFGLATLCVII